MAVLQVGRVGVDVDIDSVSSFAESTTSGGGGGNQQRQLTITGLLRASTLANTQAIRTELLATRDIDVIPVTWTQDATIDGYYKLTSAQVQGTSQTRALTGGGLFPFSLSLLYVGNESTISFQSLRTGTFLTNNVTLVAGEEDAYWAPPVGATSVKSNTLTTFTRASEDGTVTVYEDVVLAYSPTFQVTPANYYLGAAYVSVGGYTRAGLSAPNNLTTWQMGNALIRVTNATTFDLNIDVYDGSVWDDLAGNLLVRRSSTTTITPKTITILHNTPEMCAVRLVGESTEQWTLDLQVRRGSRLITGVLSNPANTQGRTYFNVTADAISPAGAGTTAAGSRHTATSSGNRSVLFSANASTRAAASHSTLTTPAPHEFAAGAEVNYIGGTGDTAIELANQYFGWVSETVTPILT